MNRLLVILAAIPAGSVICAGATPGQATRPIAKQASLDDEGQLRWRGRTIARLALPPKPRVIRYRSVKVAGRTLIHVSARATSGRAAEALFFPPRPKRKARFVFRGATGPMGVDGEWSVQLAIGPKAVLRYQRRDGVYRCDGRPATLFTEAYDFVKARFRAVIPRRHSIPAKVIVATRDLPRAPSHLPLNTFSLQAASTQSGDRRKARNLAPPIEADDGRAETAWSESIGGFGRGEFLTARAQASPYALRAVSIIPGDAKDAKTFARANRIKSALLLLSKDERYRLRFTADPLASGKPDQPYWFVLPKASGSTCATLVIESVYPGVAARGGGRTAISELRFYTELDFGKGLAQVVADLGAADDARQRAAVTILKRIGGDGVKAVSAALPHARGAALQRSIEVLTARPQPDAIVPLVNALPRLRPALRQRALAALTRGGDPAIRALAPLLQRPGTWLYRAAARTIGRIGSALAVQTLLPRLSRGSAVDRRAVIDGLATTGHKTALEPFLARLRPGGHEKARQLADVIVVASRLAAKTEASARVAKLIAPWATAERAFELRYRALRAIGRLDVDGQLDVLLTATHDRDAIIRLVATEQLRRSSKPKASIALRRSLDDKDPRVRATAAIALLQRSNSGAAGALARALSRERWNIAARAIAEALGRHCSVAGYRALSAAIRGGSQGVDERALLSLVRCRPAGLARRLLRLALDRSARAALRKRALAAMPNDVARANADPLVSLFHRLRRSALRSSDDEEVAAVAAGVLSRVQTPNATRALVDTLALDASGPVRAAAARAISRYCPPGAAATVRRAERDGTTLVRQAAALARKVCRY